MIAENENTKIEEWVDNFFAVDVQIFLEIGPVGF